MAAERNEPTEEAPQERLPYDPPRILSVEPLEAVAAACDTAGGQFGKELPPCSTLGS